MNSPQVSNLALSDQPALEVPVERPLPPIADVPAANDDRICALPSTTNDEGTAAPQVPDFTCPSRARELLENRAREADARCSVLCLAPLHFVYCSLSPVKAHCGEVHSPVVILSAMAFCAKRQVQHPVFFEETDSGVILTWLGALPNDNDLEDLCRVFEKVVQYWLAHDPKWGEDPNFDGDAVLEEILGFRPSLEIEAVREEEFARHFA